MVDKVRLYYYLREQAGFRWGKEKEKDKAVMESIGEYKFVDRIKVIT